MVQELFYCGVVLAGEYVTGPSHIGCKLIHDFDAAH
jgi:hypothetical protein